MFLDDLQWADPASLSLLPVLLSHPSSQYLLVIGAFRDTEVGAAHPVSLMIDEARRAGVTVAELKLYALGVEDVCHLLRDTLRCTVAAAASLATLVHKRTDGNPFFVVQLLHFLHDCSLIRLDPLTRSWCWDLPEISARGVTGSVVDLMTGRINKLSAATREALKIAACLGASFTLRVMSLVTQQSPASALRALAGALREGLVYTAAEVYHVLDDYSAQSSVTSDVLAREVRFDFLHDRVQQAAYALIPEANRPHFRLQIGRLLRTAMSDADLQDKPFDVVNNLNFGAHLLTDPVERYDLAQLNLTAGRKARTALAYDDAVGYLRNGLRLLPATCWEEEYQSSIALHEECFECEYLTGNFAEADSLFRILQARARSKLEKARAYYTKVLLSTSLGRADEAVHVGIEGLRLFGLRLPATPTKAHLLVELALVRLRLGRRRPEQLLDLPCLTDADQEAAIRLLMIICPAAYFKNPDVMFLAALKIVKMSLRSGNASVSSFGYILFALMLGAAFGRYELGHAFGRLAVALSRNRDEIVLRCKVLMIFGGFVNFWRQPVDTSTALLAESFRISLDAGDVQYANYSVLQILFLKFFRGAPLNDVLAECDRYEEFVTHTKDTFAVDNHRNWKQSVLALQGKTNGGAALASDSYDEAAALTRFRSGGNLTTLCYYYTLKSQLAYLFSDYDSALAFGEQAETLVHCAISQIVVVDHYLYFGLAAAAALRRGGNSARRLKKTLRLCRKKLRTWAVHCPANFRHHWLLLEAEAASVSGQPSIAMRSYDAAVESATANQALQLSALSNELAARFYVRQGQQKVARTYMIDAQATYLAWGAFAKLKHLESEHNELLEPLWPAPLPLDTERASGQFPVIESPSRSAALSAAQAISSEVRLDRLLEKLLRLVLQCAGAQNAAFAFEERGVLRIEAEGRTDPDEVRVLHSVPVDAAASVCSTVIQQVARTRSVVVLHDASLDPHYRNNPYVVSITARSVLGLPVVLQGSLLGVLYMENNLMPGVFTPERLEQVTIIASEVVIALENARLQHRLQTRDSDLQAAMRKVELLESVRAHLSKFVPQHAQRAIAADPENPEMEKRERDVSILFLDVAGYTRISEALDKELVDSLIERYFSEFLDEIRRNGGDVNETTGDGLMVIFQDPDPMQHAILAAQAAIAIRGKTRRLNTALAENATPVLVNIGINSGPALVGVKRFEGLLGERHTYTASGPVTNLAARLATTAIDGEILVSEETARRVAHDFLLKDLGARRFKNMKDSVRVFGLLQVNAAEEREAGREPAQPRPGQIKPGIL